MVLVDEAGEMKLKSITHDVMKMHAFRCGRVKDGVEVSMGNWFHPTRPLIHFNLLLDVFKWVIWFILCSHKVFAIELLERGKVFGEPLFISRDANDQDVIL